MGDPTIEPDDPGTGDTGGGGIIFDPTKLSAITLKMLGALGLSATEALRILKSLYDEHPEVAPLPEKILEVFNLAIPDIAAVPELVLGVAKQALKELLGDQPGYFPDHGGGA